MLLMCCTINSSRLQYERIVNIARALDCQLEKLHVADRSVHRLEYRKEEPRWSVSPT